LCGGETGQEKTDSNRYRALPLRLSAILKSAAGAIATENGRAGQIDRSAGCANSETSGTAETSRSDPAGNAGTGIFLFFGFAPSRPFRNLEI
jgi:hypothetical protein